MRKNLSKRLLALLMAMFLFATGLTACKKKNETQGTSTSVSTSSNSTKSLSDLGNELYIPKENVSKYSDTTGNINKDDLVEKDDKIYVDQDSLDKSNKTGNTSVDTKGDTLIVKPDGTVVEKEEGYEIIEDDKVIESGEGNLPNDYVQTDETNKYLPEGYTYSDATYYNEEGEAVLQKGAVVSKETLEYAKKNLSTIKPSNTIIETQPTTSNSIMPTEEGILNPDGTYTIYGLTFLTYEDYNQWIKDGGEGYSIDLDGIMKPIVEVNETQKVKKLQ